VPKNTKILSFGIKYSMRERDISQIKCTYFIWL